MSAVNFYETDTLASVTGHCLRPGGLNLTDRALDLCRIPAGARVLDVGCGTGATAAHLRKKHGLKAVGIDASALLLEKGAAAGIDTPRMMAKAERLPVGGGTLDAVLCECVLSLCPDPGAVLSEFHRALAPGGALLMSDLYTRSPAPDWEHDPRRGAFPNCLAGAMDRDRIDHLVTAAGFQRQTWEDHTPMLKQLAAQLVWTYGSLEALRSILGRDRCGNGTSGCQNTYGYYLMTARKGE